MDAVLDLDQGLIVLILSQRNLLALAAMLQDPLNQHWLGRHLESGLRAVVLPITDEEHEGRLLAGTAPPDAELVPEQSLLVAWIRASEVVALLSGLEAGSATQPIERPLGDRLRLQICVQADPEHYKDRRAGEMSPQIEQSIQRYQQRRTPGARGDD